MISIYVCLWITKQDVISKLGGFSGNNFKGMLKKLWVNIIVYMMSQVWLWLDIDDSDLTSDRVSMMIFDNYNKKLIENF